MQSMVPGRQDVRVGNWVADCHPGLRLTQQSRAWGAPDGDRAPLGTEEAENTTDEVPALSGRRGQHTNVEGPARCAEEKH